MKQDLFDKASEIQKLITNLKSNKTTALCRCAGFTKLTNTSEYLDLVYAIEKELVEATSLVYDKYIEMYQAEFDNL